jgi:hypothetical protein
VGRMEMQELGLSTFTRKTLALLAPGPPSE